MKLVKLFMLAGLTSAAATTFAATQTTPSAALSTDQSNAPTIVSTQEQPQSGVATDTNTPNTLTTADTSDNSTTTPSTNQVSKHKKMQMQH